MRIPHRHWALTMAVLIGGSAAAVAQTAQIARVQRPNGQVSVARGAAPLPVKSGDPLYEGDVITTGPAASVAIVFNDATTFSAGPDSELSLRQFHFNPISSTGDMLAEVKHGTVQVISGNLVKGSPGAMKIKTPTAVLNVRGTRFLVKVD